MLDGEMEVLRKVGVERTSHFKRHVFLFQAVDDRASLQGCQVFVLFEQGGHRHALDLHF
jgi:hypothetical protein